MKINFRTQLFIPSIASLILMILIGIVVFININKLLENIDWVEHTNEVIADGNDLIALMIDQETGMRGYAITGEEEFLEPYNSGKLAFAKLLEGLKQKVIDNPGQVTLLESINERANTWDSLVASRLINMRRDIKSGEASRNELFTLINSGIGKRNMDRIRKLVSESGLSVSDQNQIILDMINMETGLRGFLLNNKEEYLQPYKEAKRSLTNHLNNVSASRTIKSSIDSWVKNYAEKAIEINKEAMSFVQKDALDNEFNKKLGKKYMDEIRDLLGEFKGSEQSLLVVRKIAEEKMASQTKRTLVIITFIAIVLSIVLVFAISKIIMNQIGGEPLETEIITRKISEGDLNFKVDGDVKNSRGIYKSALGMLSSLKEMAALLTKIADGDLIGEIKPKSKDDVMGQTFLGMQKKLKKQILEIIEIVSTLNSANAQLMSTISQLSSASAETSTTVSEVTTTIEEIKQTAELSTQKARIVEEAAKKSVSISQNGIKATEDSIASMEDIQQQVALIAETIVKLSQQSQAIGNITSTVSDLAEQSNLLAVNASIEAVKAGEYGKGFGVVANEIRMLANQSKQSAKQIDSILNEVQKAISSAVMATEKGGKAVEKGIEVSETAADAIANLADSIQDASVSATQIAASSKQQLTGMEQLTVAASNIKEASNQNALGTKQAEEAVESLKTIVLTLKGLTEMYKL